MTKIPKPGEKVSKNFIATSRINSLDTFYNTLLSTKSIYARHRIYPTAFFFSWPIKTVKMWLDYGWFWKIQRLPFCSRCGDDYDPEFGCTDYMCPYQKKSTYSCALCDTQIDYAELCDSCAEGNDPFNLEPDNHEYRPGTRI